MRTGIGINFSFPIVHQLALIGILLLLHSFFKHFLGFLQFSSALLALLLQLCPQLLQLRLITQSDNFQPLVLGFLDCSGQFCFLLGNRLKLGSYVLLTGCQSRLLLR